MHTAPPQDIGLLLDRGNWTAYQRRLVLLTALTIVFDGIDNQLIGITVPTMMLEWGVPRSAFAPVVSLGYFGMMIGGAAAGLIGDRYGRRGALLGSVALFGAMTMAASLASDVATLGVLRFFTGLGLGGAIPNAAALAAEYVPARQRPMAVTLAIVCMPLGGTIAGLIAIPALPALGWRALYIAGGLVPMAAAPALRTIMPESPRYLARRPTRRVELAATLARMGHAVPEGTTFVDRADSTPARAPMAALFQPGLRRDTLALWLAYFSCLLAVYLAFSWVPSLLTGAGFSSSVASTGITAFNLGGVVGSLAGGVAIARFGSRASMLTMTALAITGAAIMSQMDLSAAAAVVPIIALLTVTGAMINGVQATMYALAAHVYPAAIRATGVGSAVSFGRSGAVLSGFAGAWALEWRGSTSFFGAIAVSMAVCWIALAAVRRHIGVVRD